MKDGLKMIAAAHVLKSSYMLVVCVHVYMCACACLYVCVFVCVVCMCVG